MKTNNELIELGIIKVNTNREYYKSLCLKMLKELVCPKDTLIRVEIILTKFLHTIDSIEDIDKVRVGVNNDIELESVKNTLRKFYIEIANY